MGLNTIKGTGNWGGAASDLNNNFASITAEIEKLKAVNVKFKGYYTTELTLKAAHPSPTVGDTAWVGAEYPGTVYDVVNGQWHDTTVAPSVDTVNLSEYATQDAVSKEFASIESDLDKNELFRKIEGIKISSGNNLLTRNYVEPSNPKEYEKGGANRLIDDSGLVSDTTDWYLSPLIEWGDNTQSIMANCRCWAQYANDGITLVDIYRPIKPPTENNTLINKANGAFFFRVGIALWRGNTMLNYGNVLLPYEPYKDIVTKRAYGETPLYFQVTVDEVAIFKEMLLSESYIPQSPTYTDGIINSPINVIWSDGDTGVLTLTRNTDGLVTKIVATKIRSGVTTTLTENITRDSDGNATNITIA